MNSIPAREIKRRGIAAADNALKRGPVHVIKNNRPAYVILREEDFDQLARGAGRQAPDVWDLLLNRPWQGGRTRKQLLTRIRKERSSWVSA